MIHRFTNRISNYNFCGKQGKNLQHLGVTKFSLKGNKYGSPIRLHQEGGKIWNRYLVQVANLWTKQHKLHKENLGWLLAILRLVLYEGKFVTTRGYTCRLPEGTSAGSPRSQKSSLVQEEKHIDVVLDLTYTGDGVLLRWGEIVLRCLWKTKMQWRELNNGSTNSPQVEKMTKNILNALFF